jgi:hypothetical protein
MNFNDVDFSKLKIVNNNILYEDKRGLNIITPKMRVPFGLDEEYGKYLLKLEFSDLYNNDEITNFYEFIKKLEEFFKNHYNNSGIYKSLIRLNRSYDPVFCAKVMERYNRLECSVVNKKDKSLTTIYDIQKNSNVTALLSFDRVWEMSKQNKLRNGYIVYVRKICCV